MSEEIKERPPLFLEKLTHEGEGEGEGEPGAEHYTGSALSATSTKGAIGCWHREEGIGEIDGFGVELLSCDSAAKVTALDTTLSGRKYQCVLDAGRLESAGMDPRFKFPENLDTVRSALKGCDFASAKLLETESGALLRVTELFRGKSLDYDFTLERVELDESDLLKLELAKANAEMKQMLQKMEVQLASAKLESAECIEGLRTEVATVRVELKDAIADSHSAKSQLADARTLVKKLKAELADTEAVSGAHNAETSQIIAGLRASNERLLQRSETTDRIIEELMRRTDAMEAFLRRE